MNYNNVYASFWDDTLAWPPDARTMALYLLTCRDRAAEGLFVCPIDTMARQLNWTDDECFLALSNLVALNWLEYDIKNETVLLLNSLRWHAPKSKNHLIGAARKIQHVPTDSPLQRHFRVLVAKYCPELELPELPPRADNWPVPDPRLLVANPDFDAVGEAESWLARVPSSLQKPLQRVDDPPGNPLGTLSEGIGNPLGTLPNAFANPSESLG